VSTEEQPPYNLPIFRRSFRAASPNGAVIAELLIAREVGMSNPTSGLLQLSTGVMISDCNPSFIWSDDSRYPAVPRWALRAGVLRGQRLLVVEPAKNQVFESSWFWGFLQPESFAKGQLVVVRNPTRPRPQRLSWAIPAGLAGFTSRSVAA